MPSFSIKFLIDSNTASINLCGGTLSPTKSHKHNIVSLKILSKNASLPAVNTFPSWHITQKNGASALFL